MSEVRQTPYYQQALTALKMTPQEQYLYQHHLNNLLGKGKVQHPSGDISTVLQMTVGAGGKTYNIPTVWGGRILPPKEALAQAKKAGLDRWPSYGSESLADQRYLQLHHYMDQDVGWYRSKGGK